MEEYLRASTKVSMIPVANAHIFREEFGALQQLTEQSGFWKARTGPPISLLSLSGNRKRSREEDYIYAIMQVFRYRLGVAQDPSRQHHISELLSQFGEKLLSHYAVESQLHIFGRLPSKGAGWHMDLSSDMIGFGREVGGNQVVLSTRELPGMNSKIGHFRGQCCPAVGFKKLDQNKTHEMLSDHDLMVHLDATEVSGLPSLTGAPADQRLKRYIENAQAVRSFFHDYLSRDADRDRGSDDLVLLLARPYSTGYGMILHPDELFGTRYWRRVGIIQWNGLEMCKMADASNWNFREGYFG